MNPISNVKNIQQKDMTRIKVIFFCCLRKEAKKN